MSGKAFFGKEVEPKGKYADLAILVTQKDGATVNRWLSCNNHFVIERKLSSKDTWYWEISPFNKNHPDDCGEQSHSNELPSSQYQREPRREEQPQYKQEPRYSRDDRPAPMPEVSQEEDDDIPF
jgi:hypothetical protein